MSDATDSASRASVFSGFLAHLSEFGRADERTRTADLLQLRVIIQVLQRLAGVCKSRISKPISLLCSARCCAVLRSRWYQSGINITLVRTSNNGYLVLVLHPSSQGTQEPCRDHLDFTPYRTSFELPGCQVSEEHWSRRRCASLSLLGRYQFTVGSALGIARGVVQSV
jgi:hypothetical protein